MCFLKVSLVALLFSHYKFFSLKGKIITIKQESDLIFIFSLAS